MGLDMNAYAIKSNKERGLVLTELPEEELEEVYYWRKNRYLHNWIEENVYLKKRPDFEDEESDDFDNFNTIYVLIDESDLIKLKEDILSGKIKKYNTEGFFFGNQEYDKDMKKYDLKFIEIAEKLIKEGFDIYYYSWW